MVVIKLLRNQINSFLKFNSYIITNNQKMMGSFFICKLFNSSCMVKQQKCTSTMLDDVSNHIFVQQMLQSFYATYQTNETRIFLEIFVIFNDLIDDLKH